MHSSGDNWPIKWTKVIKILTSALNICQEWFEKGKKYDRYCVGMDQILSKNVLKAHDIVKNGWNMRWNVQNINLICCQKLPKNVQNQPIAKRLPLTTYLSDGRRIFSLITSERCWLEILLRVEFCILGKMAICYFLRRQTPWKPLKVYHVETMSFFDENRPHVESFEF